MLLAVDVGNSKMAIALFDGARLVRVERRSSAGLGAESLADFLRQSFPEMPSQIVLGTVVPAAADAFRAAADLLAIPITVIDATNVPVAMRGPVVEEVGPDRVINVVAARERLTPPFLVIDIGTAITFDAVAADGAFVGGAIAPGPGIAADALHARTARLPPIDWAVPPSAIGTTTRAAMQSGVVIGYVGLVDGLARRIKAEVGGGRPVPCIATGGLAAMFAPLCAEIDFVDPELTLHGLRLCVERA